MIDAPEVLGEELSEIDLGNGNKAYLRRLGAKVTLKIQPYFRVIDIPNASFAKVFWSGQVKGRTVVLIIKSLDGKCLHNQVLSIAGNNVLTWSDFGNCINAASVSIEGDAVNFDVINNNRTLRHIYKDQALSSTSFETPKRIESRASSKTSPDTSNLGSRQNDPNEPVVVVPKPINSKNQVNKSKPSTSAIKESKSQDQEVKKPTQPQTPPPLIFSKPEKQEPIKIVLDKP